MPSLRIVVAGLVAVAALAGCAQPSPAPAPSTPGPQPGPITVGAYDFAESQVLARIYAGVLQRGGRQVTVTEYRNREGLQPAVQRGDVHVVPEYLGSLTKYLNIQVNGPAAPPKASADPVATHAALRGLAEPLGITPLAYAAAQDQNAFAVTEAFASRTGIATLSQLADWSQRNRLVLGGPAECPERPFCRPGLERTYGMRIAAFVPLDAGGPLTQVSIQDGEVTVGLVLSSDSSIEALDLRVLVDDRSLQPAENVVPVVRTDALNPEMKQALDGVSGALTTEDLRAFNQAVELDLREPENVAEEYLDRRGLRS